MTDQERRGAKPCPFCEAQALLFDGDFKFEHDPGCYLDGHTRWIMGPKLRKWNRRPAEERVQRWIPVEERLPEKGQNVAFVVDAAPYLNRVFGGRFQGTELGYPEFTTPGVAWRGTHWQPLPPPPKEDSDG